MNRCSICQIETNNSEIGYQLRSPKLVIKNMVKAKQEKYNLTKKDVICYFCLWK